MRSILGRMPILLVLCAPFVTGQAHSQTTTTNDEFEAPASQAYEPQRQERRRSLADLGYSQGVQQTDPESSVSFLLPLPLDTAVSNPRLVLRYAASPLIAPDSSMQVLLNGTVREVRALSSGRPVDNANAEEPTGNSSQSSLLTIPLTSEDIGQAHLNVRIRGQFGTRQDRCAAPRTQQDFVRILPTTAVVYGISDEPSDSIRGYLSTLPEELRIALAAPANAEAVRAAWLLTRELQALGHQIRYTRPEEGGDIIIAPRQILAEAGLLLPDDEDMGLVAANRGQPGAVQLAITEPYHVDSLASPWKLLLARDGYAESLSAPLTRSATDTLPLSELGLDTEARPFVDAVEWTLDTSVLPAGKVASALRLNLMTPPSSDQAPLVLYVLQNNTVRGLTTLSAKGGHQSVSIELSEPESIAGEALRIVMARQEKADCAAAPGSGYVQLLDSSVVETRSTDRAAETVMEFGRGLAGAYFVHLPAEAFTQPHGWVAALAALGNVLNLDPRIAEFGSDTMQPAQTRPFLWLGDQPPAGFRTPISFEQGRIQIRDNRDAVLLDSGELPGTSVVSLLRDGSQRGLWLRTMGTGVPVVPPGLEDSMGDLIFGDGQGVLVAMNTQNDRVLDIDYPDHADWLDSLAKYSGWFFALTWVVLTIVVISVVRRLRKSSK